MKKVLLSIALLNSICNASDTACLAENNEHCASQKCCTIASETPCQPCVQESAPTQEPSVTNRAPATLTDYMAATLGECCAKLTKDMSDTTKEIAIKSLNASIHQKLQEHLTKEELELFDALVAHGSVDRAFKAMQEIFECVGCEIKKSLAEQEATTPEQRLLFSMNYGFSIEK